MKFGDRTLTIASGAASSTVLSLENAPLVGMVIPTLTSCNLTVYVSMETAASGYAPLKDGAAVPNPLMAWTSTTGGFAVGSRDLADLTGYRYMQLVSSVNQGGLRTFAILLKAPTVNR